jgi:glycosyltransferase involved in cell wall biosynthesis
MTEEKSSNNAKVAVIIIARNEENFIGKTIENLENQELSPYRIIVVNDGSTDKTGEILSNFENIEIINREKRDQDFLAKKDLATTINSGLEKLESDHDCDFVMISGADLIFQNNYLTSITERMQTNPKIAISSGVIEGEFSIEPRGAGRVVRYDFWKKIELKYPVNYGYEGYLLWKAKSMDYEIESFSDLIMQSQRKTGSRYNPKLYYYYGIGLKALGYATFYTVGRAILLARKKPKGAFYLLYGFFSDYHDLYESELRDFVRKNLHDDPTKKFQRFVGLLRNS